MVRVSNWLQRQRRHKKFRKMAKGFRLWRKNVYKQLRLALVKQWQHAFVWRKEKKREFRKLWIERISAAVRAKGWKYSLFINTLYKKDIKVNRKVMSNIAVVFPEVFDEFYKQASK